MHFLRIHIRFLLLLALFTLGVLAEMSVLPPLEGSDEILHITYVEWLRTQPGLPDRAAHRTNCTRQESGQPPLTYALGAAVLNLLNIPPVDCQQVLDYSDAIKNPWNTPMDGWNRVDDTMTYLNIPDIAGYPQDTILNSLHVLRLISLPIGLAAIIGAYGAALEIFRRQSWALVATAVFAFMPMMVHITSYWTNDISAVAFASLIVWMTLRFLRLGASPLRLIGLGLLLGIGGLCKVSVMLIAPGVALAVLVDWRKRRLSFARLVINGLLLGLPAAILFLPWVIYGIRVFQDPIGFQTHVEPKFNHNPPLTIPETLPLMPEMYLTYIGKFGFSKIYLHPVTYTAIGLIIFLSLVGYFLRYRMGFLRPFFRNFWQNLCAQQAAVLLVVTLVVFLGFYSWLRQVYFVTGRLMYPAHVPISLAITGGLYLLAQRWPRLEHGLRAYTVGILAVAGLIIPSAAIYASATPPLIARDQLPPLQGTPIDFDHTIRFLGYQQPSRVITGPIYTLELCWEVLQATTRPAAFSVKLVHNGVILADRTSIHGMGRYNSSLWQPGAIFCDTVDIRIDDPDVLVEPQPEPAQVYDMLLVMLDARTQAVDWQAATLDGQPVAYPIIGQVVTPAGDMRPLLAYTPDPSTVRFPAFADVSGVRLNGTLAPGATLSLDLLWHVTGTVSDNWSQFIHLSGPNGTIALADGVPRGGNYPTGGWSPGEYVFDRWPIQLPTSLPSGDYDVLLGFYRKDTGERMPVTVGGSPAQDNSAVVTRFSIP